MYITATFPHSLKVEKAITELLQSGIRQTDILAIPLKMIDRKKKLFDTISSSDRKSTFDLPMIAAGLFSFFGCIYGFVWKYGPIILGLIGIAAGFGVGLMIKLFIIRKDKGTNKSNADVVLMVSCNAHQSELVMNTICNNSALGVGVVDFKEKIDGGNKK